MRRTLHLLPLLALTISCLQVNAQCANGRYYNKIFSVKSTTNVLFGNAQKFDGTFQDLKMNVYEPQGDNFARRPLIVLAFGGSFTAGLKESPDILKLCDEFARRGYVAATIDYRLGFEDGNDSDTNQFKALIRGVQDMRAAVRYFYKDAQTTNTYRVDTNQIFIGGVSAGGVIALNYGYGKEDTLSRPRPDWADSALAEVGGGIGNSGNPGYSDRVKGVINLCGAIADTVWVMPTDPVLCAVHGTNDGLVPCYYDSAAASNSVEAMLFGSGDLLTRATNIGLPHSIKLFQGAGHVPFVLYFFSPGKEYMDTTVWTIRDFLYQHVECDSSLISTVAETNNTYSSVSVFPNPTDEVLYVVSDHNNSLQAKLFSVDGKPVSKTTILPHHVITISKSETGTGVFILCLFDNGMLVKTERIVFR
ncbi:MAG: carboxylesterase family protein [Chitinophagales bacterium]|nr:carboxylesterase family protein [Chitinophagales bacterium]